MFLGERIVGKKPASHQEAEVAGLIHSSRLA